MQTLLTRATVELRSHLEDEIRAYGGDYRGNLTKDVTHLIAKEPVGKKYDYAKQWSIKIVSIEWHEQSLERGMILDESSFNPLFPKGDRGQGAWIKRTASNTILGKRERDPEAGSQRARKLRRTASAKFEAHNDGLWTNIVSGEVKKEETEPDPWLEGDRLKTTLDRVNPSAGDTASLTKDLRPGATLQGQSKQTLTTNGLFQDKVFLISGFEGKKTAIVQRHLQSHGANVVEDLDTLGSTEAYLLVPYATVASKTSAFLTTHRHLVALTDLWLERCIHLKRCEPPASAVTNMPFVKHPIVGFENLRINSTGFEGVDLLHLSKVATLMGAQYLEDFDERSSVLICNHLQAKEKLWHAELWKVPAVKSEWFWDCVRCGDMIPFEAYLLQAVSSPIHEHNHAEAVVGSGEATRQPRMDADLKRRSAFAVLSHPQTEGRDKPQPKSKHRRRDVSSANESSTVFDCSFPDESGPVLIEDQAPQKDSAATMFVNEPKKMPLQEITPNSSPPKAAPSPKARNPPDAAATDYSKSIDDEALGSTISSLLLHHQKQRALNPPDSPSKSRPQTSSSNGTSLAVAEPDAFARTRPRRRQLFGRAPSNISSRSHSFAINPPGSNINNKDHARSLTRASSIDTTNTDGLGTPILDGGSTNVSHHNTPRTKRIIQDFDLTNPDAGMNGIDDPNQIGNQDYLQMTQLGYEDPDVAAWRERVARKLAAAAGEGGGESLATKAATETLTTNGDSNDAKSGMATTLTPAKTKKTSGAATANTDENNNSSKAVTGLGIAKRTRLAAANAAAAS